LGSDWRIIHSVNCCRCRRSNLTQFLHRFCISNLFHLENHLNDPLRRQLNHLNYTEYLFQTSLLFCSILYILYHLLLYNIPLHFSNHLRNSLKMFLLHLWEFLHINYGLPFPWNWLLSLKVPLYIFSKSLTFHFNIPFYLCPFWYVPSNSWFFPFSRPFPSKVLFLNPPE